jgi:PAS domain S-box-containing protein
MDWNSVAGLLVDRREQPITLLDRATNILLFNRAMERVLGWRRSEVEGRPWADACAPPDLGRATRRWLSRALNGALEEPQCDVLTRDGRRLVFELELSLVGRRRDQGLLMTVRSARAAEAGEELLGAAQELDYEVMLTANEFGNVRRIASLGRVLYDAPATNHRCYELLYRRTEPCEDCPVLGRAKDPWPRTTVRRPTRHTDKFEIVTAEPAGATVVRLSVRLVTDRVLTAIYQARIDAVAERGRLSERERTVLQHLLLGRSLDEIATALALSRRTIKFHQLNILQKLGVDSRVELIRITGF